MKGDSFNQKVLISLLQSLRRGPVKYVSNPGNAGDSLIALGTLQLFQQIKLNVSIHSPLDKFSEGDTLVYAGGGNLVPEYNDLRNFLIANRRASKIIVLPHTVRGHDDLLSILSDNVYIFARERVSFGHLVNRMNFPENVFLAHDMAFHISGLDAYKSVAGVSELNAFRLDCEKTGVQIPSDNIDLSTVCATDSIVNSSKKMFEAVSRASVVNTNRLHVAIAASLLGKNTNFFPNSYYKNKAVFEFSIDNCFPLTKFVSQY